MVSTDGRTDGRTDTEGYNIIPRHTLVAGYNNKSNEQAHLILVHNPVLSNEGAGDPVKMWS